jgi:hypothetical protein
VNTAPNCSPMLIINPPVMAPATAPIRPMPSIHATPVARLRVG